MRLKIKATTENMIFVSDYPDNWLDTVYFDSWHVFDAYGSVPSEFGKDYLDQFNGRICEGTLGSVSPYGYGIWLDFETRNDMLLFVLQHV